MAVTCVYLSSDVYLVCLNHVLSTEHEEVMGLLIGEIDEKRVSRVSAVTTLRRSDKRRDRVEISPEQLSDASTRAEMLASELGRPMRVLGWYHSHPHITVWPSHVDVRTQAMYQMMDEGFVGLIFSVFNQDKTTKQNRVQLTCFQSINQSPEGEAPVYLQIGVAVHVVPTPFVSSPCLDALVELPAVLCQEEQQAYETATSGQQHQDVITRLHNGAVYTQSLCHITDVTSIPLLVTLENRLRNNREKIQQLQKEKEELLQQLKKNVKPPAKKKTF